MRNATGGSASRSAGTLRLAHRSAGYHAYTQGPGSGYVIVAADDECFSSAIIGYSYCGTFDFANMPDAMRLWLEGYDHALNASKRKAAGSKPTAARTGYADIAPLLTSKWGQDAPYNGKCPIIGGKQAPTGCVATALSQIIYYNRYPAVGYNGNVYDYAAMTDTYATGSTQEAEDAVAQLMHDVGLACNMNYGASVSGALNIDGARAMTNHFGYDKSAILLSRDFYSADEWSDMLYGSLASGAPVFYAGLNGSAGHAFVCDGYQNGYFHFNWGWEGISDGYFLIDALNPKDQGTGGSDAGYNLQQEAIFNLKPAEDASDYATLMYCYTDFDVTAKGQSFASTATFTGSFLNYSLVPKDITLGLKVADSTGTATWLDGSDYTATLDTYAGPSQFSIPLSAFPTAEGQYTVYPAYRDNATGTWHEMRVNTTLAKTHLIATVAGSKINFANSSATGKPQLNFSAWSQEPAPGIANAECSVSVSITNNGADFADEISLLMNSYTTGQTEASSLPVSVNIASGGTTSVTFRLTAPAAPDMYKCLIVDSKGEELNAVPPYLNIIAPPSSIDSIDEKSHKAETSVYAPSGVKVLHLKAGEALDTSSLAKGIYIVVSGNAARRIVVGH